MIFGHIWIPAPCVLFLIGQTLIKNPCLESTIQNICWCVPNCVKSGPDTTKPGNERFFKEFPCKNHQSTMLAQTLKSGPEATKPGNERFVKGFPSKNSQSTMLTQTLKSGLTQCLSGKPIFS